ncbi:MAG: PD40 domain-containing protein [Deltaproteobacteria bacterium]|nr:PD40 domain-containing protein [Deltaproteobacteria bacterium]
MKKLIWSVALFAACGDDGASTLDAMPMIDAGPGPAEDIQFVAGEALPSGNWLLASEWAGTPNKVFALDPANLGGPARTVFTATRVWSMGAKKDGSAILFSSHDPMQEAHFGVTIGDAIQNSFVFDSPTRTIRLLGDGGAWANVNDECFHPSADGAFVNLCRRYDFTADSFLGWRLGRITVSDGSFEFVRPDAPGGPFELNAQEIPGTTKILFELRARPPATGVSIHTRDLVTGVEVMVRQNAYRPVLAPDGHRVLFADPMNQSRLKTFDLQAPGDAAVVVSPTLSAGDGTWSPDGQTIVYTVFDQANSCDHIERVTWSGSTWSAPERLRNCVQTREFIANLSWITIP